jgi:hypothetical protein
MNDHQGHDVSWPSECSLLPFTLLHLTAGLVASATPARPPLQYSFSAAWTQYIEGETINTSFRFAADRRQLLVSTTNSEALNNGSMQMIDNFKGNHGQWPFEAHCIARPHTGKPSCFVGPTGVDPGSPPPPPETYFRAQFFNIFDNDTLYSSRATYAGAGTRAGVAVTLWSAVGPISPGIMQSSVYAMTPDGLCHGVDTNYTSDGRPHNPPKGTFEQKHIRLSSMIAPPNASDFAVPAGLACTLKNDSMSLFRLHAETPLGENINNW